MAYTYHDATIIRIQNENDSVRRFTFKMPDSVDFRFKAGQFVMLDLPIAAKFTNRSYSIASPPSEDNTFELCIVLKPDGLGTPYLWNHVKEGDVIKCSDALGKFVLPENIDMELCFICTGTGIAPFRSMLLDIFNKNIPHKELYMIFGNRWIKDILYEKEMRELEVLHPEFHFIPVLSRETAETWNGETGYVHHVYDKLFADNRKAYFYLCGWSAMVKEARDRLKERGYQRTELKFELFD